MGQEGLFPRRRGSFGPEFNRKDVKYTIQIKQRNGSQHLVAQVTNHGPESISARFDYVGFRKDGVVLLKDGLYLRDISPGQTMETSYTRIPFGMNGLSKIVVESVSYWSKHENTAPFDRVDLELRKAGCFVATVCFGEEHSVVLRLQEFRDNYLENCAIGRLFIQYYYSISPEIADYVAVRPRLRAVCGKTLRFLVNLLPGAGR